MGLEWGLMAFRTRRRPCPWSRSAGVRTVHDVWTKWPRGMRMPARRVAGLESAGGKVAAWTVLLLAGSRIQNPPMLGRWERPFAAAVHTGDCCRSGPFPLCLTGFEKFFRWLDRSTEATKPKAGSAMDPQAIQPFQPHPPSWE